MPRVSVWGPLWYIHLGHARGWAVYSFTPEWIFHLTTLDYIIDGPLRWDRLLISWLSYIAKGKGLGAMMAYPSKALPQLGRSLPRFMVLWRYKEPRCVRPVSSRVHSHIEFQGRSTRTYPHSYISSTRHNHRAIKMKFNLGVGFLLFVTGTFADMGTFSPSSI